MSVTSPGARISESNKGDSAQVDETQCVLTYVCTCTYVLTYGLNDGAFDS